MSNALLLKTLDCSRLSEESYDIILVAHGFESRAIAVAGRAKPEIPVRCALGFNHNQVEAFETNGEWLRANGFTIIPNLSDKEFSGAIRDVLFAALKKLPDIAAPLRIAIDVSCFDRFRLAEIVESIRFAATLRDIEVDYWYCIAKFAAPIPAKGRNEFAGPIHPRFAGRFSDPSRPLALIAGLGYEIGKVMGAAEYVQAARVIALFPESPISAYQPMVHDANKLLLDDLDMRDVIPYPVDDPERTIATLDAVVRGLQETHNIVLLPGGPKIFVLGCLIVQTMYPETSVWRVSSGSSINSRDVLPSANFVGLRWRPASS